MKRRALGVVRCAASTLGIVVFVSGVAQAGNGIPRQPCVSPGSPPGCDSLPRGESFPESGIPPGQPQPSGGRMSNPIVQMQLNKTPEKDEAPRPPADGTVTVAPNPPPGNAPPPKPKHPSGQEPAGPAPANPQ